jgi:hypothetical protein
MKVSFIVSIDPVKGTSLLNVLVHSLNLQTCDSFNVVFYNQTRIPFEILLDKLEVQPRFPYLVYGLAPDRFLGQYPIWDVYELHTTLLDDDVLNDYFMALHTEEFFDVDYVEKAIEVLQNNNFDIMFGNLSATRFDYDAIEPILSARSAEDFDRYLADNNLKVSPHWALGDVPWLYAKSIAAAKERLRLRFLFNLRTRLRANPQGYTLMRNYLAEDLYFMKKEFARKYNWFLRGHHMYFEDVHICEQPVICELGKEVKKLTPFPVYFNVRRIYHLRHRKYYYQLVDDEFTRLMLEYDTEDPILMAHKKAIAMYRSGAASLEEALTYTRRNPEETGTQNVNYKNHMLYLGKYS